MAASVAQSLQCLLWIFHQALISNTVCSCSGAPVSMIGVVEQVPVKRSPASSFFATATNLIHQAYFCSLYMLKPVSLALEGYLALSLFGLGEYWFRISLLCLMVIGVIGYSLLY